MAIRVVRLGSPRGPSEGLRLGTVRRPPRGVPKEEVAFRDFYDVWLPDLAPSESLLKQGLGASDERSWKSFVRRYRAEMKRPEAARLLVLLAALSHRTDLAVGCYCADEARCHRSELKVLLLERGADIPQASTMPSRSELVALAKEWVAIWRAPVDWPRFDALHAASFEDCSSAGRPSTKEGFAKGLAEMTRAFPDLVTVATDVVVDETVSKVAVRWRAEGTNRERYLGAGPTQRRTVITGIEIIEIQSGQIVRRWGEWDISDHLGA